MNDFIKRVLFPSYKRTISIIVVLILALSLPVTLRLIGQQQDVRQRASSVCYQTSCWTSDIPTKSSTNNSITVTHGTAINGPAGDTPTGYVAKLFKTIVVGGVGQIVPAAGDQVFPSGPSSVTFNNLDGCVPGNNSAYNIQIVSNYANGDTGKFDWLVGLNCSACTVNSYTPDLSTFCGTKSVTTNCGTTLQQNGTQNCGNNQTCTNNACANTVCTPTTSCAGQGKSCGSIYDGCKTVLCGNNGSCTNSSQSCNNGACTGGGGIPPTGKSDCIDPDSGACVTTSVPNCAATFGMTPCSGATGEVSCILSPNPATVGQPITFYANNGTGPYSWNIPNGNPPNPSGNPVTSTITTPGKWDVKVTASAGGYNTCSVTVTGNPTPTNPTPTNPAPTVSGTTSLAFSLSLPGIGNNSDQKLRLNNNPKRATRPIEVAVINADGAIVKLAKSNATYNSSSSTFNGTAELGSDVSSGNYTVKVRMNTTLWKVIPDIISISQGSTTNIPAVKLVSGDIDQDNSLNVSDYNSIIACIRRTAGCKASLSMVSSYIAGFTNFLATNIFAFKLEWQ